MASIVSGVNSMGLCPLLREVGLVEPSQVTMVSVDVVAWFCKDPIYSAHRRLSRDSRKNQWGDSTAAVKARLAPAHMQN